MEEIKYQLVTSFVHGIGKTTGGLLVVGLCLQIWNSFNNNYTTTTNTKFIKSKSTQTEVEEINVDIYKKIFDELA